MAPKDIKVAYGVDVDAVAGWLGSYGGEDSPDDISRGLCAGYVTRPSDSPAATVYLGSAHHTAHIPPSR